MLLYRRGGGCLEGGCARVIYWPRGAGGFLRGEGFVAAVAYWVWECVDFFLEGGWGCTKMVLENVSVVRVG